MFAFLCQKNGCKDIMKKLLYNFIFIFLIAAAAVLTVINIIPYINYFAGQGVINIGLGLLSFFGGAVVISFLTVFLHEIGHILIAKFAGFKVVSFRIFNRETIYHNGEKIQKKIKNNFSYGSCELISVKEKNLKSRFIAVTAGGLFMSLLVFAAFLLLNVLLDNINPYIYAALSTGILISLYVFISSLLPAEIKGTHTDGAVIYGLTKNKDYAAVLMALLKIQTALYKGKTPSEIDRELYFNVPLLSDDHISMLSLYSLRQMYYLDSGDYEKAAQTNNRILHFADVMSMEEFNGLQLSMIFDMIKANDYKKADAAMKLLENENLDNITALRIKAYYCYYVSGDREKAKEYAIRAKADSGTALSGIIKMEHKLIDGLQGNF